MSHGSRGRYDIVEGSHEDWIFVDTCRVCKTIYLFIPFYHCCDLILDSVEINGNLSRIVLNNRVVTVRISFFQ